MRRIVRHYVLIGFAAAVPLVHAGQSASQAPGIFLEMPAGEGAMARIPGRPLTDINTGSIKTAMLLGGLKKEPITASLSTAGGWPG